MTAAEEILTDTLRYERHGEYLLDRSTGELTGLASRSHAWQPTSDQDIDWVLSLFLEERTQIEAVERQRTVINKNLDALRKEHERTLSWLEARFGGVLEQLLRDRIEGRKERSRRFAHGVLQLRKVPGKWRLKVAPDDPRLVAWAKGLVPSAVKVFEKVNVSEIPADKLALAEVAALTEYVKERETFTVDVS